jgi:zinc protease
LLQEELSAAAYRVHPYGHTVIGHQCDLEQITRKDLYRHYRTYYVPNNAVIAVAGAFNAGEMLRVIERFFNPIEPGDEVPALRAEEPPQRGERRVIVEGQGGTDYVEIGYHTPAASHPDIFALTVLSAVLAGATGSLIGRGGLTNHTSRLYKALVTQELAASVDATLVTTLDPGLYQLSATVLPNHSVDEVETAILTEVDKLRQSPISATELAKAKRQARALFAYASESITNQGFWLGFSEIFADYTWYLHYLDKLDAVTADDVLEAAQQYLRPQNRTVGHYVSQNNKEI